MARKTFNTFILLSVVYDETREKTEELNIKARSQEPTLY